MKKQKATENKKRSKQTRAVKGMALSQIFIIIMATVAFSLLMNASFVKADPIESDLIYAKSGGERMMADIQVAKASSSSLSPTQASYAGGTTTPVEIPGIATPAGTSSTGAIPGGSSSAGAIPQGPAGPAAGGAKTGAAAKGGLMSNALVAGVVWAAVAYFAGQLVGGFVGLSNKNSRALGISMAAGAFTYKTIAGSLANKAAGSKVLGFVGSKGGAALLGLGVAVVIFVLLYKKEKTKTVIFTCLPWQPPIGGASCEQCNKDPFRPCSEYRCKALGQACELLNKDKPGMEKCAWVNPKDVNSPTIIPWVDALTPSGLSYIEDTSLRPPALGVKIVRKTAADGCLQAFTPLEFGINTNEPAQCKLDFNHTAKFDDMAFFMGETNAFMYNHSQAMKLPGPNASTGASPILKNDGTMQLFIRCMDANKNQNVDEYTIKFCVDKSPDTTPPFIEGTSITSGSPVQYNADKVPIEVYVNEPAQCKWSLNDREFKDMENSMNCALDPGEINARLSYTCEGNLTGIKNREDNKFYFRCMDNPLKEEKDRNVMTQSYAFVLKGSQPLNIIAVSPNGTITGSTEAVTVDLALTTDDGVNEGQAFCYFSPDGQNDSYIGMFETNSYQHKQTLQLTAGDYSYYFRCIDLGGNSAEATTTFSVFSDKDAPKVTKVYREQGAGLKVVTNEDAECVYSLNSCNYVFNEGLKMIYSNPNVKTNNYAEWKPNIIYYIKCRDMYGNEPNPNECSVIARPLELTSQ